MIYILTVTLHLVAMVLWLGPLIVVPAVLARHAPHAPKPEVTDRLRATFRALATPGLVLTWVLGIANAVQSGAFEEGWLHVKLVFVLALSALHGVTAGQLRRLSPGGEIPALLRNLPWIVLALAFGAILMAEWQPF